MSDSNPADSRNARHEEFVALLTASHEKLLGYLLSLLGRWHDAQDVLQRASILMGQKFGAFERGSDFVAWASTICFYEAKKLPAPRRAFAISFRRRATRHALLRAAR